MGRRTQGGGRRRDLEHIERQQLRRKKAEQRLGRAMAALIWHMVKRAGGGRRPLAVPDLDRLRGEDRENR
jgi:hypothetical protein